MRGIFQRIATRLLGRAQRDDAAYWEGRAADMLRAKGLEIVARNVRTRLGEIDIIAVEGRTVVFVEVKKRSSRDFGGPEYAIQSKKRRRIIRAAKEIIVREKLDGRPCRFDAVLIYTGTQTPEFQHIADAFGE